MNHRICLSLMEQLIMILIFAIISALCLQGFATAERISFEIEQRDQAILLIQNTAEQLKSTRGQINEEIFRQDSSGVWQAFYDDDWTSLSTSEEQVYRLEIIERISFQDGLGMADIQMISSSDEACLFQVTIAWQEVEV